MLDNLKKRLTPFRQMMYKSANVFVFASTLTRYAIASGFFIGCLVRLVMFTISVKADVAETIKRLNAQQKQIAFATAVALTKTAQQVKSAEIQEMRRVFDRPTPYTLNSLFVKPATKTKLEAHVFLKDDVFKGTPASKYLIPQIAGGDRKTKRFERALINSGVMPSGYYAVPASAAPIDSFGNIQSRFLVQLLSYLRSFGEQGYKANMTQAGRNRFAKAQGKRVAANGLEYFVVNRKSHLPLGIYQRIKLASGSSIKPVILFVKTLGYQPKFNFVDVANKTIKQTFQQYFNESIKYALATAR